MLSVNQMQVLTFPEQPTIPQDETWWVKWFHHLVQIPPERDRWEWGYIRVRPAVAIVALNESTHVSLVSQFRYPFGAELVEIPKGFVNDNEEPLNAAKRELQEEVGVAATQWHSLGDIIAAPGIGRIVHHVFLARGLFCNEDALTPENPDEPPEPLKGKWLSFDDFFEDVIQGVITDAVSIAAIEKARRYLGRATP